LSGNIHREDSDWKSQVSVAFHYCFTEKCCSLVLLYMQAPFFSVKFHFTLLWWLANSHESVSQLPGVQRFSGVRDLGGDEAEKTSGRDLSNFISMT
jgi:hypothetical protein